MSSTETSSAGRLNLLAHIVEYRAGGLTRNADYLAMIVLLIAVIFFVYDLYTDLVTEGQSLAHVALEGSIFLSISLALCIEVFRAVRMRNFVSISRKEIDRLKAELTGVIRKEFDRWELNETEKEIALFLIKGLSMQEIAAIRQVKEKTVRQQASTIYTKSGLSNRHELSAYFIEDLLAS